MNAISANDLGLAAIVQAWQSVWETWLDEVSKPDADNFDTKGCLHWEGVRDRLEACIKASPISCEKDAKAFIQFIWRDSGAYDTGYEWEPNVARWCLEKLMEWTQSAP